MSAPISIRAELAAIAKRLQTVAAARAAVGHATEVLSSGYEAIGSALTDSTIDLVSGVHSQARSNLDDANAYAKKVYDLLPSDDASQARALTLTEQLRVAEVIRQTTNATSDAIDVSGSEFITWDDFVAGFETVAAAVGTAAGNALKLPAQGLAVMLWAFIRAAWLPLLVILVVLVVVIKLRARALRAVVGGAA